MFLVTKATIHVESISFGEFIIKMFATLVKLVKDPTPVEWSIEHVEIPDFFVASIFQVKWGQELTKISKGATVIYIYISIVESTLPTRFKDLSLKNNILIWIYEDLFLAFEMYINHNGYSDVDWKLVTSW